MLSDGKFVSSGSKTSIRSVNNKNDSYHVVLEVLGIATVCKICLMFASYRSTDFEVHRNWLAITYSLPVNEWYFEDTSEWTLDYPPLFAWFEFILANIAVYFDRDMLKVQNLNYSSKETILFQKLSVILSDSVLAFGIYRCCSYLRTHRSRKCSNWKYKWRSPTAVLLILVLGNCGLLVVDHIHFQYNGMLIGLLLLSISNVLEGSFLQGAFFYSLLLGMKHIFLYVAPVYLIYFLRNYCFAYSPRDHKLKTFSSERFTKLASVVLSVVILSFGPFIYLGQLYQVISRLFPFKRGLTHAYWAPNFWALYNFTDKILSQLLRSFGVQIKIPEANMSGGLVQEYDHVVLPSVSPHLTLIITLISVAPCLWKLWTSPNVPLHFVRCIVLCSSCFFLFGWHVHEKAILISIIPLAITSVLHMREAKIFIILSTVGNFTLLPLIPNEVYIKYILYGVYIMYMFYSCSDLLGRERHGYSLPFLNKLETLYIVGLLLLFLYDVAIQYIIGYHLKYPFLNLMLISVYCSIGVIYSITSYYYYFVFYDNYNFKSC